MHRSLHVVLFMRMSSSKQLIYTGTRRLQCCKPISKTLWFLKFIIKIQSCQA